MDLRESYDKLLENEVFKGWKSKEGKDSYLCSCFVMKGENMVHSDLEEWQFGFFSDGKIVGFVVGDGVKMQEADTAFKKENDEVLKLDLDNVKFRLDKALVKGEKEVKQGRVTKKIIILQNWTGDVVWNLSFITDVFEVVNVKIDAVDGKILSKQKNSLLQFRKS